MTGPAATLRTGSGYRPEIDGIRGLAVIAVLLNHCSSDWLPGGYLGVDAFFVISGFVITGSLQRTLNSAAVPQPGSLLLDFYRRRLQRLVPALAVFVLVTAVLCAMVVPRPGPFLQTGLASLFGLSNISLEHQALDYFSDKAELNPFTHTWSLAVEEQFYLLFPLLFLWLAPRHQAAAGRLSRFDRLLIAATLVSFGLFLIGMTNDLETAYFRTVNRIWELLAGCLLHRGLHTADDEPQRRVIPGLTTLPAGLGFGLLLLAWAVRIPATPAIPLAVISTVLLIAGLDRPSPVRQLLLLAPVQHLGRISYSLYLWHWGVLSLARWTVSVQPLTLGPLLALVLLLAQTSWYWLEMPLRHRVWHPNRVISLAIGLAANALTALLVVACGSGSGSGSGHASIYTGRRDTNPPAAAAMGPEQAGSDHCFSKPSLLLSTRQVAALFSRCSSPPAASPSGRPPHLFIVGDSHAAALAPLTRALAHQGLGTTLIARAGCPFPAEQGHQRRSCQNFQRDIRAGLLARLRPGDRIVVASYLLSHLGEPAWPEARLGLLERDGTPIRSGVRKLAVYTAALEDFARSAQQRGAEVIVLAPGPRLVERELCLPEWHRPPFLQRQCQQTLNTDLARSRAMTAQLRTALHHARVLDLIALYCPQGCDPEAMRRLLSDRDHLSATAVLRLLPSLRAAVLPQDDQGRVDGVSGAALAATPSWR